MSSQAVQFDLSEKDVLRLFDHHLRNVARAFVDAARAYHRSAAV